MLSSLDVIDAFLTVRGETNFATVPGRELDEFGERVREFSSAHTPALDPNAHPIYLGGWPSANFALLGGDMILSSLLYSGQVLVNDPIADWFATEQYRNEHMLGARRGYCHPEDNMEARMHRTRAYLNTILPSLEAMRPLIEAGIVVPVASESFFFRERAAIDTLRRGVTERITINPVEYAHRFAAGAIATDGNMRGYFTMAPDPDPSEQIRRAMGHGIRYFAREYALASAYGVTYTAPFAHERFLCEKGISPIVGSSTRVVEAVLRSGLPEFHGLTPRLVRDIHDDDAFADFRARLHEVYQHTPTGDSAETDAYVRDQENALLRPLIQRGERAASGGFISRLGGALSGNKWGIAAALAADLTIGTVGAATAINVGGAFLDDAVRRRRKGPHRIWSSLVRHNRSVNTELTHVAHLPASVAGVQKMEPVEPDTTKVGPWGIPAAPSMSYVVTAGELIWDADPRNLVEPVVDEEQRARLGVYGQCRCGSGRKHKFCCAGLR
ncbi:hypothetical protein ACO03V_05885 [Microbacterium sp. HMH0099]|uniref:hypothetical protein n=1 Tax=Microbacterium sp. HMH0099 TaxID=3414026 RepID=UPI003BF75222